MKATYNSKAILEGTALILCNGKRDVNVYAGYKFSNFDYIGAPDYRR